MVGGSKEKNKDALVLLSARLLLLSSRLFSTSHLHSANAHQLNAPIYAVWTRRVSYVRVLLADASTQRDIQKQRKASHSLLRGHRKQARSTEEQV